MSDKVLQEQLDYYRARAQEYDESIQQVGRFATEESHSPEAAEFEQAANALRALAPLGNVLELAAGTGVWTTVLAPISASLTVIDGSPEMLAINRSKISNSAVQYECVDLFSWEPIRTYDLVVFGFWLSHVPPDKLDAFLDKVKRAVKPGGRVFIIDEPANGKQLSGPNEDGQYQMRTLYDGRTFGIIKVYYDPAMIGHELEKRGFEATTTTIGEYVFYLSSIKGKQDH
jgi:2-polyprenyl-3-methyl-5-hydroxy-6-metoxy-1,4-benzoquinol methylase